MKRCDGYRRLLNEVASRNVKVVVVGNPANTNAWVLQQTAVRYDRYEIDQR